MSNSGTITAAQRSLLINALVERKPFYGEGIFSFPSDQLNLFLEKDPHRINLSKNGTSNDDLEKLAAACEAATFGVNKQDVLDESYRKAGKLDKKDFGINIDIVGSGLLDAVHSALFGWEDKPRSIKAELYKLNVYGPGSFFKAHKDTPRGEDMFGSLVLNFQTKHEGGALVLRHDGGEVVHDASAAAYTSPDQVSWVTFYSDVEHEVLPVKSGYRVTLTYNLYFSPDRAPVSTGTAVEPLVAAFKEVIQDESFMPDGGRLGFALKHQYPVPADLSRDSSDDSKASLQVLSGALKGSDRALFLAAALVGLEPKLAMAYELEYAGTYLLDTVYKGGYQVEDWNEAMEWEKGEKVEAYRDEDGDGEDIAVPFEWITPRVSSTRIQSNYVAYGNDAQLDSVYGDLILVASLPPAGERHV